LQKARMIGNYVDHLAQRKGISYEELGTEIGCNTQQVRSFLKGRSFVSFSQLVSLAKRLGVSVADILEGDRAVYSATVVHCMNDFEDESNREMVLDIIDDYLDILDSLS